MDWSGIEGNWWRLRPADLADEAAIREHGRGPDPLWLGIGPSSPPERAQQVLGEFMKGADGGFGLVQLAVSRESNEIIGMISAQERGSGVVEIAYGVAPAWRRRGLASEILKAVTQVAQKQDWTGRYELIIDAKNAASIRVAEKCGYRFVGTRHSVVENTGESYEDLVYLPSWCEWR